MIHVGSTTRFGKLAFCLALSAVTLTACGKKADDADTTETATTADTTNTGDTAAAAPAAGAPAPDNVDTVAGVKYASYTGDVTKGKTAFIACQTCHDPKVNKIGPHLDGVVGRKAGSIADFNYSAANKNSGITWTEEKLFQYLEAPQRVVPGTKMSFAGFSDPQKRADVIAYLKTLS